MNLLDNAIKYTREGGVALKVGLQEERVRFLVEDTGIGIQPEHLTEIFAVFHQVRDPRAAVEGTGLGLAISKRLVRVMGGDLQVASSPGEGSRFWFDLDLPEVSAGRVQIPRSSERTVVGIEGDPRRVLVVDDDEESRGLLRDLLKPLGFEVFEATNGQTGVHEALRLTPHVILMDLRMPELDGLAAIRQIRAAPDLKDTVIIAISASASEQNRAGCLEAGADDFLPKPFRQGKLLELLSRHLELKLVYTTDGADSLSSSHPPSPDLIMPPAEELHGLLDLARRGDIKNLLRQAKRLEDLGEGYGPFADRLRSLAEAYEIKKLRHWLTSLGGTL